MSPADQLSEAVESEAWWLLEVGEAIMPGDEAFNRARRWDDAVQFGDTVTADSPPIRRKFGTVKSSVRSS